MAPGHCSLDVPPTYEEAIGSTSGQQGNETSQEQGIMLITNGGTDPIVARAYWNQTQSQLVRLPDALIVSIMERLDLYDIIRLRHVSRDFMRLFSQSQKFRKYHLTDAHNSEKRTLLARVWATPLNCLPSQHLTNSPRSHDKNGDTVSLCSSCVEFRKKRGYVTDRDVLEGVPFIYCAGCKMEHRAFYFSPQQRHESNDDERLCHGREGFISLCEHISITWDVAQQYADARQCGPSTIECNNAHSKASPCKHIKEKDSDSFCDNDQPKFKFWKDEDGKLVFEMSVTTHLPFQQLPGPTKGGKVSSVAFRRSVQELVHKRLPVASFRWLPTNHLGRRDISKCFDPNICSCLDWGEQRVPATCDFEWKLCPNPIRPWRRRPDMESPGFTGINELLRQRQDRCAGFSHNLQSRSSSGSWSWEFNKCPKDKGFLVFRQTVRSCATSPHDFGWYWFINDRSTRGRWDTEMRAITWCPGLECRMKKNSVIESSFHDGNGEMLHHRTRT